MALSDRCELSMYPTQYWNESLNARARYVRYIRYIPPCSYVTSIALRACSTLPATHAFYNGTSNSTSSLSTQTKTKIAGKSRSWEVFGFIISYSLQQTINSGGEYNIEDAGFEWHLPLLQVSTAQCGRTPLLIHRKYLQVSARTIAAFYHQKQWQICLLRFSNAVFWPSHICFYFPVARQRREG